MKKSAVMVAVMALCSASIPTAQQDGFSRPTTATMQSQNDGFVGPNGSSTTVGDVKSLRNDTWVALYESIVECIFDGLYVLKGATSTVNVDIDYKRWNGVVVIPQDMVEIQGEVGKDWNSVEIGVGQTTRVAK